MFVLLAVATAILFVDPILTNQELRGWLALPVVAVFLAGAWFVQGARSLQFRFQREVMARVYRLRWPDAGSDLDGGLALSRLARVGLFLLTYRHDIGNLLQLEHSRPQRSHEQGNLPLESAWHPF